MKARADHGRRLGIAGRWLGMAVVAVGLAPAGAGAWTHRGDATIEDKLGVGTEHPERGFHLQSHAGIFRIDRDADPSAFMLVRTAEGNFNTIHKAYLFGVKGAGVNDGEFTIRDMGATVSGSGGAKRMTIANDGRVSFGDLDAPLAALHVRSPMVGDLLRLDAVNGTEVFSVEEDGDIHAFGGDLELRQTSITSGGFTTLPNTTVLANTADGPSEESFLALNGDTAIICSPGNDGLLQLIDQDYNYTETVYTFYNSLLDMNYPGNFIMRNVAQGEGHDLIFLTTGEGMDFIADYNNDTAQSAAYTWYNNGNASANTVMQLTGGGNLRISGTLSENYAFDIAEAYWKSEEEIVAGDVVCFDPEQPNAVVLARTPHDVAVVGVVSTDPGIVMGGGAFSAERLEELWGDEVAAQFASERKAIERRLASGDAYIQGLLSALTQMKSDQSRKAKKKDLVRMKEEYVHQQQKVAAAIEGAALEAFCREHLAQVALAGRVPVKVDASYGAIRAGDLLVASATPGRAMRADNPAPQGTVIGKAMESLAEGRGTIMMVVLNR